MVTKKTTKAERERRKGTRELNEELSRYYALEEGEHEWECPHLLLKGKHGRDH